MADVHGFVLAAGLGTRLRPVTDYWPKPLLPVVGEALLDRAARALLDAGCERVVVNAHHRADRVAAHLRERADRDRFHLSLEPTLLGTAGAFDGARAVLADADHFLVFNGDVLCDLALGRLLAEHRRTGALATLALVDHPAVNTVRLGADGVIGDLAGVVGAAAQPHDRLLTFTGLACYRRDLLELVPPGPSDLVTLLGRVISEGRGAVRGLVHGGQWDDLGTLPRYLAAHRRRLGPGFVSVGQGARVPASAVLDECVVLPGARVPDGLRAYRAVIGRGWAVSAEVAADPALAAASLAGFTGAAALEWFTGHGSDRRFARLRAGDRRAVLMAAPASDPDLDRTVSIATFLYDLGLGAPAVLARDQRTGTVVFEDLGDQTLERLVQERPADAPALYDRVLDRLADLQTFGVEARHRCPTAWARAFDREHLRWETDYFRQRFLIGHAGLAPELAAALDAEFAELATACLAQPRTLVHRDFQSQNILFKDGVVRLVDVQGMRWGPQAYDVVSLLDDPYVDLDQALRDDLLASFPARLAARSAAAPTADQWRAMALAAGLQRLMQALGAYAFLGHVKGRPAFLRHIPVALRRLGRLVAEANAGAGEAPLAPPPLPLLGRILEELPPA
jgi:NDP-sugar pyrophosphorylase family protein/aminoglycoside/choline kinase family phosphotransferase